MDKANGLNVSEHHVILGLVTRAPPFSFLYNGALEHLSLNDNRTQLNIVIRLPRQFQSPTMSLNSS